MSSRLRDPNEKGAAYGKPSWNGIDKKQRSGDGAVGEVGFCLAMGIVGASPAECVMRMHMIEETYIQHVQQEPGSRYIHVRWCGRTYENDILAWLAWDFCVCVCVLRGLV